MGQHALKEGSRVEVLGLDLTEEEMKDGVGLVCGTLLVECGGGESEAVALLEGDFRGREKRDNHA